MTQYNVPSPKRVTEKNLHALIVRIKDAASEVYKGRQQTPILALPPISPEEAEDFLPGFVYLGHVQGHTPNGVSMWLADWAADFPYEDIRYGKAGVTVCAPHVLWSALLREVAEGATPFGTTALSSPPSPFCPCFQNRPEAAAAYYVHCNREDLEALEEGQALGEVYREDWNEDFDHLAFEQAMLHMGYTARCSPYSRKGLLYFAVEATKSDQEGLYEARGPKVYQRGLSLLTSADFRINPFRPLVFKIITEVNKDHYPLVPSYHVPMETEHRTPEEEIPKTLRPFARPFDVPATPDYVALLKEAMEDGRIMFRLFASDGTNMLNGKHKGNAGHALYGERDEWTLVYPNTERAAYIRSELAGYEDMVSPKATLTFTNVGLGEFLCSLDMPYVPLTLAAVYKHCKGLAKHLITDKISEVLPEEPNGTYVFVRLDRAVEHHTPIREFLVKQYKGAGWEVFYGGYLEIFHPEEPKNAVHKETGADWKSTESVGTTDYFFGQVRVCEWK